MPSVEVPWNLDASALPPLRRLFRLLLRRLLRRLRLFASRR